MATEESVGIPGDMQAVIDTAHAVGVPKPFDPDQPKGVIVPDGARLVIPDLSAWRAAPTRPTGVYAPATVEAFTAYVKNHLDEDATTVWVHPTSGRVVAVIDDNGPDGPAWGQHRADLQLQHTPEWDYWNAKDGKSMGQEAFANHIEAGLNEIAEPDGATVLEIAQTFHAKKNVSYRSSTRLTSGQVQFLYDEEIKATAGQKGELTIPTTIRGQPGQ